jgi:hypothetical protein
LILQHLKKIVISIGYNPKYISNKKKRKKIRSKRCLLVSTAENLTREN